MRTRGWLLSVVGWCREHRSRHPLPKRYPALCVLALLLASHENASWAKAHARCPAKASNGAIELQDGHVLLAAMEHSCIYDPKRGSWSRPIPLQSLRLEGHMTRLLDGSVLLVGGQNLNMNMSILEQEAVAMTERFLPAQQTWVQAGSLQSAQGFFEQPGVATRADGHVLAVSADTELFNATFGGWLPATHPGALFGYQSLVALPDGHIWVLGGCVVRPLGHGVVSYDGPLTTSSQKTWWLSGHSLPVGNPDLGADIRSGPTQAGVSHLLQSALLQSDHTRLDWQKGPPLQEPHAAAAAVVLRDGSILVAGGFSNARNEDIVYQRSDYLLSEDNVITRTVERLYPKSGRVERVAPMQVARFGHTLVVLPSDHVLALGGIEAPASHLSHVVEEYDPARNRWRRLPPLRHDHYQPTAMVLEDGSILVASLSALPEIYRPPRNR